jgi:hypothetical protein
LADSCECGYEPSGSGAMELVMYAQNYILWVGSSPWDKGNQYMDLITFMYKEVGIEKALTFSCKPLYAFISGWLDKMVMFIFNV